MEPARRFPTAPRWFATVLSAEEFALRRTHRYLPKQAELHSEDSGEVAARSNFSYNEDLDLLVAERMVPGNNASPYMVQHVARYLWAMSVVRGHTVVDLGCGDGYGTNMLSWVSPRAVGVDLDPGVVRNAIGTYGSRESVEALSAGQAERVWPDPADRAAAIDGLPRNPTAPVFHVADLSRPTELPAVRYGVCFEVMEHLENPKEILAGIARSRIEEVLFSVPNPLAGGSHINPHHVNDWSLGRFKSYLREAGATGIRSFSQGLKRYQIRRGAFYWDLNWLFRVRF